jgi:hypothetical protein
MALDSFSSSLCKAWDKGANDWCINQNINIVIKLLLIFSRKTPKEDSKFEKNVAKTKTNIKGKIFNGGESASNNLSSTEFPVLIIILFIFEIINLAKTPLRKIENTKKEKIIKISTKDDPRESLKRIFFI